MNLLGPCLNPARPKVQLLGVADPKLLRPIAETLRALGVERALVVHGSGLDEVALHGFTAGRLGCATACSRSSRSRPEQAGLERTPLQQIAGGSPEENARRLEALLSGTARRGRYCGRRAQCRRAADDRRARSTISAKASAMALRRDRSGRAQRGARRLRRGEPWLNRHPRRDRRGASARSSRAASTASRSTRCAPGRSRRGAASLRRSPRPGARFILEIKKASPSAGAIRLGADPAALARGYAGVADALSVLCDRTFFGGSLDDLAAARARIRRTDPRQGLLHRPAPGRRGADRRRRRGAGHALAARRRRGARDDRRSAALRHGRAGRGP